MNLTPAIKGLITAALMIAVALITYYTGQPASSPLQYSIYFIYGIGIIWTLVAFKKSAAFTGKFGNLFGQGFRCFIVVTLLMVVFTAVFSKMHPEFAEESAVVYKEELLKNPKDRTPAAIDEEVARFKKGYTTALVYGSVFGYLIIGAGVTAFASALLTLRKK